MNKKRNWWVFVILFMIGIVAIFNMTKIKDLSPKFKIPKAEKELELLQGQVAMGSQQGGLNLYSNKFKRGYGNAVFGSDENGIWLGAAEFADSPFNVDMDGALVAKSATFIDGNEKTIIDAGGLVGSNNFVTGRATRGSNVQIDSTTFETIPGWLGLEVSSTRPVFVLCTYTVNGKYTGRDDGNIIFRFIMDEGEGTEEVFGPGFVIPSSIAVTGWKTVTGVGSIDFPAGLHTIKVQAKLSHAGDSANLAGTYSNKLNIMTFGK